MNKAIKVFVLLKYIAFMLMLCFLIFLLLRSTVSRIVSQKDCNYLIQNGNAKNWERYAERNKLSMADKNSLLSIAVVYGKSPILDWLINNGADVNAKDDMGCTPLHAAARVKKIESIDILLKHGANVNSQDKNGNTPLHAAIRRNSNGKTIDFLLRHNADVNIANSMGQTPIFVAVSRGHPETVKKLIEFGADTNVVDMDGKSPLAIVRAKQEDRLHEYMKKVYKDIEVILIEKSQAMDNNKK